MTTATRWWAPTAAAVGVSDSDLEMLTASGGNPRLDLGASLLAAHRVGGAACLAAADAPLLDARTLAGYLGRARAELADPLVDSVSKSVNRAGSYGALLVRDLLDDADDAAIELFSAAVARGISPAAAARRAADVYGVSKSAIGRYRAAALDPKTKPDVLTNLADKTLMEFVSKLSAEEADDREVVSKAPPTQTRTQTVIPGLIATAPSGRRYYDGRDEEGRFTEAPTMAQSGLLARMRSRYGIGGQAAPKVDTGRPTEVATERETKQAEETKTAKDPQQVRRTQQQVRQRRRQQQRAKQQRKQRETTERPTQQRSQQVRGKQTRAQQARLSTKTKREKQADLDHPADFDRHLEANHPYLASFSDGGKQWRQLDNAVGFVLDEGDALHFNETVASSPNRMARIGHLEALHGGAAEEAYHGNAYQHLLTTVASEAEGEEPSYRHVRSEDIPEDPVMASQVRDHLIEEYARAHGDEGIERTAMKPDSEGDGWVIYTEFEEDAPAQVYEYIVHRPKGWIERGTQRNLQVALDPNQAYRVADRVGPEDDEDNGWQKVFDRKRGILRTRIHLIPVDEDEVQQYRRGMHPTQVKKAVTVLDRPEVVTLVRPDDPSTSYYDGRDALGRFAPAQSSGLLRMHAPSTATPVPVATPEQRKRSVQEVRRRQQQMRASRKRRKKRPVEQETVRPAQQMRVQQRRGQHRNKQVKLSQQGFNRVDQQKRIYDRLAETLRNPTDRLQLNPNGYYRLMDKDELEDIAYHNASFATLHGAKGGHAVLQVRNADQLDHIDADDQQGRDIPKLIRHTQFDLMHALIPAGGPRIIGDINTGDFQGQYMMASTAHDLVKSGKHGMVVEVPNGMDADLHSLHLHAEPEPMVLIEFHEGAERNGPYDLIHVQDVTHYDTSKSEDDHYTGGMTHHYNVPIERWLAVSPQDTERILQYLASRSEPESGR